MIRDANGNVPDMNWQIAKSNKEFFAAKRRKQREQRTENRENQTAMDSGGKRERSEGGRRKDASAS